MGGRALRALFLIAFSLICSSAQASNDESSADVRCVLVSINMGASGTAAQRAAAIMVAMYFFGRLDARLPRSDVERLIASESKKITRAELRTSATYCGTMIEEKGQEFARLGKDFERLNQNRGPQK